MAVVLSAYTKGNGMKLWLVTIKYEWANLPDELWLIEAWDESDIEYYVLEHLCLDVEDMIYEPF